MKAPILDTELFPCCRLLMTYKNMSDLWKGLIEWILKQLTFRISVYNHASPQYPVPNFIHTLILCTRKSQSIFYTFVTLKHPKVAPFKDLFFAFSPHPKRCHLCTQSSPHRHQVPFDQFAFCHLLSSRNFLTFNIWFWAYLIIIFNLCKVFWKPIYVQIDILTFSKKT